MTPSVEEMTEGLRRAAAKINLGGSLKIDLGPAGVIHIADGAVTDSDHPADCTVFAGLQTFAQIYSGMLDTSAAYMRGALDVVGSESIAFRLTALLDTANGRSRIARFSADADVQNVIEALNATGAAIIEHCIDDELANRVFAELRPHFDAHGREDESDFNGFSTNRVYSVLARSCSSAELIAHDTVMQVADAILLPHCINYRVGSCSAIEILPGEVQQRLHRDDGIYPIQLPGVELQFSAMWSLTNFSAENGATHVLPGSHGNAVRIAAAREGETVQATMPKGSVLFYLGSMWHGGGANKTDAPRIGLINTYALGWLRQEENHYTGIPRNIAESYPKRVRQLIGYQSHGRILGSYVFYEAE